MARFVSRPRLSSPTVRFFAPIHQTTPVLHHPPHLPTPPSSSPARAPTAFGSGCGWVAMDLTAVGAVGALAARVGREAREVHIDSSATYAVFHAASISLSSSTHLQRWPSCLCAASRANRCYRGDIVTSCRCDFSCIGAVGGVRKDSRCRLLGM